MPDTADGSVEVRIELPDDVARGVVAVVFERIVVAASGRVVAEHADPDDLDQTVYVPALTSSLQLDTSAPTPGSDAEVGDAIVDVVHYSGLAIGERYRMEMTLHERLADGTCVPTDIGASVEFEPTEAAGTVEVRGAELPRHGVFVAFEHLLIGDVLIAAHDDCDDVAQTLRVAAPAEPAPTTTPTRPRQSSPPPSPRRPSPPRPRRPHPPSRHPGRVHSHGPGAMAPATSPPRRSRR